MIQPNIIRPANGGVQKIYRFANGRGASVVQNSFSYGARDGLWELAVLRFHSEDMSDYSIDFNTPITNNVLGHLSGADVYETLCAIRELSEVSS